LFFNQKKFLKLISVVVCGLGAEKTGFSHAASDAGRFGAAAMDRSPRRTVLTA
jgi:hypothetical protein